MLLRPKLYQPLLVEFDIIYFQLRAVDLSNISPNRQYLIISFYTFY